MLRGALVAAFAVLGTTAVVGAVAQEAPRLTLAGDFDGDGRADLYRPGPGDAHEAFAFAQPDGSFAVERVPHAGSSVPVVGDFDGDGLDDVLHASQSTAETVWYGGADRGLSRVVATTPGDGTPVTGDFDGDGRDDVYWSRPGRARDSIWYGATTRRFSVRSVSGGSGTPLAADLDGDRRTDLLWIGHSTVWYATDTRGAFAVDSWNTPPIRTPLVGDFDGNGTDDVLWYGPGTVRDYVDYGTQVRVVKRVVATVGGTYRIGVGDFDADGADDLVLNGSGSDAVWYGTRLRGFDVETVRTSSESDPVVGDFDGDRRDDVYWADVHRVWHGDTLRSFHSATAAEEPNRVPAFDRTKFRPYGYVAHAMGRIEHSAYTNSLEAFEVNYADGFRVFEVDLLPLRDGTILAAHDHTERWLGMTKTFREATMADVRGRKWVGKYTVLTGPDLIDLLATHRDAYFILDTKWSHVDVVTRMLLTARDPQVARRLLPHVEGQADLDAIRRRYPLQHYVLALYRTQVHGTFDDPEVLAFVRRNGTPAVMMWIGRRDPDRSLAANSAERRRYTPSFESALRAAGSVTYVHSTDDAALMEEFEERGIGIYADSGLPQPATLPLP